MICWSPIRVRDISSRHRFRFARELFQNGQRRIASISAGSTMDNQIVRELFTNVIAAAQILKTDTAFVTGG